MTTFLAIVFWISSAALVFPHLIYPVLLYLFAKCRKPLAAGNAQPRVTLIISAFNEAQVIGDKLENSLALDYPPRQLEILVISDASDDGTDAIVEKYASRNVRLCRQQERLGKSAGLTRFCPLASGEILVFTDANSMFRADAIRNLVRHFDRPLIGYTVGSQQYHSDRSASAESENLYWSLELRLKAWESRLSSVVGADGAIYALRKSLFEPLEPEDINDFVIPLKVVARGYRGIFEPTAVCYEEAAPSFRGEFRRKYRIVNRSVRAVAKVPQALNPWRVGWFAWQLFSHKVLRWLGPLFLLLMLGTSARLAWIEWSNGSTWRIYTLLLGLQLCGYLLAVSYLLPPLRQVRLIYIAYYFLLVNVAAAVGVVMALCGKTIGVWKPQR